MPRTNSRANPRSVSVSLPDAPQTERERGYGFPHQRLRRRWRRLVEAGRVACARCGRPILPWEHWDLGHEDHDRTRYAGPEHRRCNRATAGRGKSAKFRSRAW